MSERDAVSRPHHLIVAIDGPAGAGKSTVAAYLAHQFGLLNLETGAMYRALAFKALAEAIPLDDADAVTALTARTSIALQPDETGNRVLLDGVEITGELREARVTSAASRISIHPAVRSWMVHEQRTLGLQSSKGVVMEGRDIGTVVFPEAPVKIFLDASVEARGDRRFFQQVTGGSPSLAKTSKAAVVQEIADRDSRDRERAASPLRPAASAVVIDTTALTLEEVLARAASLVQSALST